MKKNTLIYIYFIINLIQLQSALAQDESQWVESQFSSMTLDEKIGQFFMIPAYSNKGEAHVKQIENLVLNHKVGGILFFQGTPFGQAVITNRLQSVSKTPLLIGLDAETGLGMRLDNAIDMPKALTLGAIQDEQYVYNVGKEIGRQCKRIGVHINFAPSVDIASEPNNPIISYPARAFGEWSENVASKGLQFSLGQQSEGVMAVAKHFPGHGATTTDSHVSLPTIYDSESKLFERELVPFKRLIDGGVGGVITGHLFVPNLDNQFNTPATISKRIVTDILKNQLNFNGLVFTDAMNMRAITKIYTNGEADLRAFMAGNDIILQSENAIAGIARIKEAVLNEKISLDEIDTRVKKVLSHKFRLGLHTQQLVELSNLQQDINNTFAEAIRQDAFEQAITVVKNDGTIPIQSVDNLSIASVVVSGNYGDLFQKTLSKYAGFKHFAFNYKPGRDDEFSKTLTEASAYQTVVIGIHDVNGVASKNYGITPATVNFIQNLSTRTQVILCVFGNPYALKLFAHLPNVICCYEDNKTTQMLVPQIIFGALPAKGKLPVSVNQEIGSGHGIDTPRLGRLSFGQPEQVGMNGKKLEAIDRIATDGVQAKAYPGCQVLIAHKGKIIYNKNFGSLTHNGLQPVTDETLYDIASMTKVSATVQGFMWLQDQGKINLNAKASEYLEDLKETDKSEIYINDLLLHQAGLPSFVPYWAKTRDGKGFKAGYYKFGPKVADAGYDLEVTDGFNAMNSMRDSVWTWLKQTPVSNNGGYNRFHYSDLGLMILQKVLEKQTGQPIDEFTKQHFFAPLGMSSTLYNPKQKFNVANIAPTEQDNTFRERLLQGTVHDPNAALLGGVAGHAGLFSTANDLAILFQMNLQGGIYANKRYLSEQTIQLFSQRGSGRSHRGLGWDKPDASNPGNIGNIVAATASSSTYGHSGFTGTVGWIDPSKDLIFIFLSNRVHPTINNKLMTMQIRQRIHEAAYAALQEINLGN